MLYNCGLLCCKTIFCLATSVQKWGGGVEEDRVHAKGKAISNLDSSVTPLAALPVTSSWLFVILVFLIYLGYLLSWYYWFILVICYLGILGLYGLSWLSWNSCYQQSSLISHTTISCTHVCIGLRLCTFFCLSTFLSVNLYFFLVFLCLSICVSVIFF